MQNKSIKVHKREICGRSHPELDNHVKLTYILTLYYCYFGNSVGDSGQKYPEGNMGNMVMVILTLDSLNSRLIFFFFLQMVSTIN